MPQTRVRRGGVGTRARRGEAGAMRSTGRALKHARHGPPCRTLTSSGSGPGSVISAICKPCGRQAASRLRPSKLRMASLCPRDSNAARLGARRRAWRRPGPPGAVQPFAHRDAPGHTTLRLSRAVDCSLDAEGHAAVFSRADSIFSQASFQIDAASSMQRNSDPYVHRRLLPSLFTV